MPSRLTYALFYGLLYVRGKTVVRLRTGWRRLVLWLSSGVKYRERLAEAAWWRGDGEMAIECWSGLAQEQPGRAVWPLKISQAVRERGDIAAAERVLLEARDRGIDDEAVDVGIARYGRMLRRSNAAVDEAAETISDPTSSPTRVFHSAFYLMAENRLDTARTGFERVLRDRSLGPLAQGHLAAIGMIERARSQGRPEVPGWLSPAQNSIVVREPSSDTTVVALAPPYGAFGLSVNALHAMLSSTGVNAIYLFDSSHLFHLAGCDRFGPGYQAMIDGVRAMVAEMGTRKLIMLGGSLTGYTAMLAAMDLNADGVLAFSPLTVVVPTADPSANRSAHLLSRLRQEASPMLKNLRPLLLERRCCPRIEIYYSASNPRDRLHASNIAGLPGVVLNPIRLHHRHDCLTEMAFRGYSDLLKGFASP